MATDDQWRLVEEFWDQQANSACTLELRDRIAALEANMKGIAWAFDQHAAKWQQDEDVERVAGDPPIATVEELLRCYGWAFMEAVQKGDATPEATELAHRAVYDLGRQHGAAANSKSNPNSSQIRSSAPTVGLKEMLARVRNEGSSLRGYAATDVIEAVAAWMMKTHGWSATAEYFAALLREEAGR